MPGQALATGCVGRQVAKFAWASFDDGLSGSASFFRLAGLAGVKCVAEWRRDRAGLDTVLAASYGF